MAAAGQYFLIRPLEAGTLKLPGRHGKLGFERHKIWPERDVTAWDCFDGAIRNSGGLLLERGKKLHLLGQGGVLVQSAKRNGDFPRDLRAGPVKDALEGLFPLRCLLPGAAARLAIARYAVSWKRKHCGSLTLWQFTGPFGSFGLVELEVRAGKPLEAAKKRLAASGAEPAAAGAAYGLLAPGRPVYNPKPQVQLRPAQPALAAATAIIRSCLSVARQNEAGVVSDLDTEFLHDYRISLRRIRTVLSLFKGVFAPADALRLKTGFAGLMAETSRLRDLDVYLLKRDWFYAQTPRMLHPGLDAMFDAFAAERRISHQSLALHLAGARYKWQIAAMQAEFAEGAEIAPGPRAARPVQGFAQKLIWKRYSKLCRIADGITPATPDAEIHRLRISCKKLRYLIELFAPLFPASGLKPILKPLKKLQNTLGDFNDCSVQQAALLEFAATPAATREIALSAGALIAVLGQNQNAARAQVETRFQAFNSPRTQRRFQTMFRG
ncbi:MAG: CHAD domain-containing protein [Leisingera sp.]